MVAWLLDVCQIDKETKGCDGRAPLLCAAEGGAFKIVELLRQRGANIHAIDENGDNALDFVNVYPKDKKMIKYLKDLGLKCTKKKS